jgi:hypothetical protein
VAKCRLTLPSRGCPKGCAFCAPLMSNVRRRDRVKGEKVPCRKDFTCSRPAIVIGAEESVAKARSSMYRQASRSRIGSCSSTTPLVKSVHALAIPSLRPSSLVALVNAGGESKQVKTTMSPARSVPVGSGANSMAAAQTTTPNPSIEGMPKRLRLLCTPHVKR